MVAVAGMIVASVVGLGFLWRGPLKHWEVPEEGLFANKLITLPTAFLIVFGFFYATPKTEWIVLGVGGLLSLVAVRSGVTYAGVRMRFKRYKEVVAGDGKAEKIPVLAGDELTPWAKATMQQHGLTEQQCFAGTPHDPYEAEQMWTPISRIRVYQKMMWLFIITMFCGTSALSWLAYGIEVKVTRKAASEILNPSQIPTVGSESK